MRFPRRPAAACARARAGSPSGERTAIEGVRTAVEEGSSSGHENQPRAPSGSRITVRELGSKRPSGERNVGRPLSTMGVRARQFGGRPCDWPGCAASADPSVSLAHGSPESSVLSMKGAMVRAIGLDVHRDFCEVAIAEEGKVRSAGRIATRPEVLEIFAQSLTADDRVALEVTGNAWEIARIIEPHLARVVVVYPSDTGILDLPRFRGVR